MSDLKQINPQQLSGNAIQRIGTDWMLVTARKGDQVNTMTAAWGGLGVMWGKPAAFVVIRPQRYTYTFVEASDTFSLTFFDDSFRETLNYLGTVSGRDEDKIKKSKLTLANSQDTPYFTEASQVLICRKLYRQTFDPDCFIDPAIHQQYKEKDYHIHYIAEIIEAYQR